MVANCGVVFGVYKVIIETTKAASELRKTGLEIDKLRLEIEEKKIAFEKANSLIQIATMEEIKEYAMPRFQQQRPERSVWLRRGAVILGVAVLTGSATFVWKQQFGLVYERPHPEINMHSGSPRDPIFYSYAGTCSSGGTLTIDELGNADFHLSRRSASQPLPRSVIMILHGGGRKAWLNLYMISKGRRIDEGLYRGLFKLEAESDSINIIVESNNPGEKVKIQSECTLHRY